MRMFGDWQIDAAQVAAILDYLNKACDERHFWIASDQWQRLILNSYDQTPQQLPDRSPDSRPG